MNTQDTTSLDDAKTALFALNLPAEAGTALLAILDKLYYSARAEVMQDIY